MKKKIDWSSEQIPEEMAEQLKTILKIHTDKKELQFQFCVAYGVLYRISQDKSLTKKYIRMAAQKFCEKAKQR